MWAERKKINERLHLRLLGSCSETMTTMMRYQWIAYCCWLEVLQWVFFCVSWKFTFFSTFFLGARSTNDDARSMRHSRKSLRISKSQHFLECRIQWVFLTIEVKFWIFVTIKSVLYEHEMFIERLKLDIFHFVLKQIYFIEIHLPAFCFECKHRILQEVWSHSYAGWSKYEIHSRSRAWHVEWKENENCLKFDQSNLLDVQVLLPIYFVRSFEAINLILLLPYTPKRLWCEKNAKLESKISQHRIISRNCCETNTEKKQRAREGKITQKKIFVSGEVN